MQRSNSKHMRFKGYADGGKVTNSSWLDRAQEKSIDIASRGISSASRIGKGEQTKKDLPFAVADTVVGLAGTALTGAANGLGKTVKRTK